MSPISSTTTSGTTLPRCWIDIHEGSLVGRFHDVEPRKWLKTRWRMLWRNEVTPQGVVFHTDRGIEFTNHHFQALLKKYDFKHSVNRPSCCTDNAYMKSFCHSLKGELIKGVTYSGLKVLRKPLGRYINKFYNLTRLHPGLGYQSPMVFERGIA